MSITRAQLEKRATRIEKIHIEHLADDIHVKTCSHTKRSRRIYSCVKPGQTASAEGVSKLRSWKIIDQLCDEKGNAIFTDADVDFVDNLPQDDAVAIEDAIDKFNGEQTKKKIASDE